LLSTPKRCVPVVLLDQRRMRATFDDRSVFEHDYFVCMHDRGQAMRDDESRLLAGDLAEIVQYLSLRLAVE